MTALTAKLRSLVTRSWSSLVRQWRRRLAGDTNMQKKLAEGSERMMMMTSAQARARESRFEGGTAIVLKHSLSPVVVSCSEFGRQHAKEESRGSRGVTVPPTKGCQEYPIASRRSRNQCQSKRPGACMIQKQRDWLRPLVHENSSQAIAHYINEF